MKDWLPTELAAEIRTMLDDGFTGTVVLHVKDGRIAVVDVQRRVRVVTKDHLDTGVSLDISS